MTKTICSTIRRQLDEMMLGEQQDPGISRHLSECSECRDLHEKQTNLRQLVGSLGTVNAPSDFDFRLRSRLTSDKSNGSLHSFWLFGQRTAVVAAAVLIIVGAVFVVREFRSSNTPIQAALDNKPPSKTAPGVVESVNPANNQSPKRMEETVRVAGDKEKERVFKRNAATTVRNNRLLTSEDQASSRAPLVRAPQQTPDQIFPIDASQQSLRVSLFDGRGNPRTISLPTVTFGSQRVVPTATSFAPKGVW